MLSSPHTFNPKPDIGIKACTNSLEANAVALYGKPATELAESYWADDLHVVGGLQPRPHPSATFVSIHFPPPLFLRRPSFPGDPPPRRLRWEIIENLITFTSAHLTAMYPIILRHPLVQDRHMTTESIFLIKRLRIPSRCSTSSWCVVRRWIGARKFVIAEPTTSLLRRTGDHGHVFLAERPQAHEHKGAPPDAARDSERREVRPFTAERPPCRRAQATRGGEPPPRRQSGGRARAPTASANCPPVIGPKKMRRTRV